MLPAVGSPKLQPCKVLTGRAGTQHAARAVRAEDEPHRCANRCAALGVSDEPRSRRCVGGIDKSNGGRHSFEGTLKRSPEPLLDAHGPAQHRYPNPGSPHRENDSQRHECDDCDEKRRARGGCVSAAVPKRAESVQPEVAGDADEHQAERRPAAVGERAIGSSHGADQPWIVGGCSMDTNLTPRRAEAVSLECRGFQAMQRPRSRPWRPTGCPRCCRPPPVGAAALAQRTGRRRPLRRRGDEKDP